MLPLKEQLRLWQAAKEAFENPVNYEENNDGGFCNYFKSNYGISLENVLPKKEIIKSLNTIWWKERYSSKKKPFDKSDRARVRFANRQIERIKKEMENENNN